MDTLKIMIQSVISFLIIEAFLLNMVSDKGFQKLIKMCGGMFLILILLNPLMELFGTNYKSLRISEKVELDKLYQTYEKEISAGNKNLAEYYWKEYEHAAKEQIQLIVEQEKLYLGECNIEQGEDGIHSIYITVSSRETESNGNIKTVVIKIDEMDLGKVQQEICEKPQLLRIRNEILSLYGVKQEQVMIVEV